jgi:histidinol-phosphate aminotransferase
MAISRRHLLRRIAAAAAAATAAPSLAEASLGAALGGDSPSAVGVAGGLIRLNRNENAYGPSAKVIATLLDAVQTAAHRYPDIEVGALRNRIARFHGLPSDRIVLGCGSGEVLRLAVDAFVGSRHSLIVAQPTYDVIGACAKRAGADIIAVPLRKDFSHDLPAMLARSDAATGLVYICNPNNPTGSLTRRRELEEFIRELPQTTYVLIDEAYHHYVGESPDYASFIDRPVDDSRVIVARSFSKIYGLAGLRAGYAVAAPETARQLASGRLLESINVVAARAALAALDDQDYVRTSVTRNVDDRQEFVNQAHARMVRTIDSQTNFVMVNVERPALETIERFRQSGILLPPPAPSFEKYMRVSLGSPAEMRKFWEVWDLMPARHSSM